MDTRQNAEAARDKIDSTVYDGRTLRVRLAAHAAAIRIKNLSPQVTNELLAYAFRFFGEIERSVVVTDDKGKSIGEGVVEYSRKASAMYAIKRCQQDSFLLTASPMPVLVEAYDQHDEEDGLPERSIAKHTPEFQREREVGPRFAEQGTFEQTFASRWKHLYDLEKVKREKVEEEIREARRELQDQIEYSRLEHDELQLKNKLKQLEDDRLRLQQLKETNYSQNDSERTIQSNVFRQRDDDQFRGQLQDDYNRLNYQDHETKLQSNVVKNVTDQVTGDQAKQPESTALNSQTDLSVSSGLMIPNLVSSSQSRMVDMNQQQYMQQPPPAMPGQQMIAMPMFSGYPPQQMGHPMMMNYPAPAPPVSSGYPQSNPGGEYMQRQKFKPHNNANPGTSTGRPRKRGRF